MQAPVKSATKDSGTNKEGRAAAYVRVSTDQQRYSIDNQIAAINGYAARNGLTIVEIFADQGKSGLTYEKRDALKRLIETVQAGRENFGTVLVLDVTRWGRFQDVDESAYYEYICRRNHIKVHYVAEPFDDTTPLSAILKAIKRAMAGEYSRELSVKVIAGKHRLGRMGFRQGGTAGYGLRRALVDEKRHIKKTLEPTERKSWPEERIILVPGPPHEVRWVRRIYRYFVEDGLGDAQIVKMLNARGIITDRGRTWTAQVVKGILTNEKYIGHSVQNKSSYRLRTKHVSHPPHLWIRADNAFERIIPETVFRKAQEKRAQRKAKPSDQDMLTRLKTLYGETGHLSARTIDSANDLLSSRSYRKRFGGMQQAYDLIGYKPRRRRAVFELDRHLVLIAQFLEDGLIHAAQAMGVDATRLAGASRSVKIGRETVVSLVVCRHTGTGRRKRWAARLSSTARRRSTMIAAVRMDDANVDPAEYYLIPCRSVVTERIRFPVAGNNRFAEFRCRSREQLFQAIYRASKTQST